MSSFTKLMEPLTVGSVTIRNRILMGSMHTGLEEDRRGYQRLAAFYAERAKGEVGLIVTGGIAPSRSGWVAPFSAKLTNQREVRKHRTITSAVHYEGGLIAMQILHSGRYGYHPLAVAPSRLKSPISPFTPWYLPHFMVEKTINDFVACALRAKDAGYDGVEIMGSEGYLINQFIAPRTNKRQDQWGGSFANRCRFPLEIVKRTRQKIGDDFLIIFRLSMLDLVENGSSWDEVVALGQKIELAGASMINTGIGWHEARIPTIATRVPRGAFSWVTAKIKPHLSVPIIATNRINTPEIAENILQSKNADMVSMARPLLADSYFAYKSRVGRPEEINTCIACNQACLDHAFKGKIASCLVNPLACHETILQMEKARIPKKVAVVGAGPAGLSAAVYAKRRGHEVTLFEAEKEIGGQFNMAKLIPGKEEFHETIRYFSHELKRLNIDLRLNCRVSATLLKSDDFDEIIIATGVIARIPQISGINHQKVLSYIDVIKHGAKVGQKVAIIGAGGIGFDVAEFLSHDTSTEDKDSFNAEWGVDTSLSARGGVVTKKSAIPSTGREIYLLQRKEGKLGANLGKTTGWIHRSSLKNRNVKMLASVTYQKIDDSGLSILHKGETKTLEVDHVIVCAGQESLRELYNPLVSNHQKSHLIGGAKEALELDAKTAIYQGAKLAASL